MKDNLAELLLVKIMEWSPEEIAQERPYLQDFARYKYDEYQQFSPGMRFIESLAVWLKNFKTVEERRTAYAFVKNRLIFISQEEMIHLASTAYPDLIKRVIIKKAASLINVPEYMVDLIIRSTEFKVLHKQCLFLGLSDGAHTDIFRRANSLEVRQWQVSQVYDISPSRMKDILNELEEELGIIYGRTPQPEEVRFKMIFLLDDFSGSGKSYFREDKDLKEGKIAKFYELSRSKDLSQLMNIAQAEVCCVLYVCSHQAYEYLQKSLPRLVIEGERTPEILVMHELSSDICLTKENDSGFCELCEKEEYYDSKQLEDKHTKKGGKNVKYGFGECRLPLVLFHNTPNNSVHLLWAYPYASHCGLFPRAPRHKELT